VIRKTLKGLPDLEPEKRALAEEAMLDRAAQDDPSALARFGTRVREMVDPDGQLPPDPDPQRPKRFLQWRMRRDGSMKFAGYVDAEHACRFKAMLEPAQKYRDKDDTRGYAERAGDLFAEILLLAANCPDLPTHNGLKADVALTVSMETLEKAKDDAILNLGNTKLSVGEIRRILCDARILPAVMGGDSKPLDVAVPAHVVPAHIRRGLVLRDRGCTFPGCEKPASISDSHHIRSWIKQNGPTQLENLVLLCGEHHRLIHRSEWTVELVNGWAYFTPPAYIDPLQQPRYNTLHRLRLPTAA
jgi:hypothetical protein